MKILVAEDEPEILNFYKLILESLGHQVETTKDGKECMEAYCRAFDNGGFNLVILDYRMPVKNGLEVAGEISTMAPLQAMLLTTAYYGVLDLKNRPKNMTILPKPFDIEELIAAIDTLLTRTPLA
jgi:DNA-binding response OmpR family regulator